jgi:hypothetical protein
LSGQHPVPLPIFEEQGVVVLVDLVWLRAPVPQPNELPVLG